MIIKRKAVLKEAPPLIGTEVAVYIGGDSTGKTDGFTFAFSKVNLSSEADSFTVEWGDGAREVYFETMSNLSHTYGRKGLYRIRLCDNIANVSVSASSGGDNREIFAPMVRELRMTSSRIHSIVRSAFTDCCNLVSVDLQGSAVRNINSEVFSGCTALSEFNGFDQVQKLTMLAFENCVSLPERIDLPNLTEISAAAIYSPFLGTNIREFHFAAKNESVIKALQIYTESGGNLGVEGAVCVFDL